MRRQAAFLLLVFFAGNAPLATRLMADESPPSPAGGPSTWVLIAVGLPGDADRASRQAELVTAYKQWFRGQMQVPTERLLVVTGPAENESVPRPASAKTLETAFTRLRQEMAPTDRLWLITLGHGNYDGRRAFFHVAGPDPPSEKWRQWLDGLPSAHQTLWLTHSTSGWFVPALSRKNRVVIAATATDEEANETEFPRALAAVFSQTREQLDRDQDGRISVAELFQATQAEVERMYGEDKRIPTEHSQLDDNGDGRGTEKLPPEPTPMQDGGEARQRHW